MKIFISLFSVLIVQLTATAQMVMNGAQVLVQNGAYVVLTDGNAAGITVSNTNGGFVMNDALSRIRWHIYSNYGNYTVPYYYAGSYLPLSFSTSLAQGGGYLDLGTYTTPTWKNSDYLPPGVTNVDRNGVDNSSHLVDRFWSIDAAGYVTRPTLSNLIFTYRDAEWNAPGNSINEVLLKAQRWNSNIFQWSDMAPAGTANTSNNTVAVSTLAPANFFQWWTLVDATFPLPLQLLSFKAWLKERRVDLVWTTAGEKDTKEFVVERSTDRLNFQPIITVAAAGNSTIELNYSTVDPNPYQGVSYYRLKMIDLDGKFSYSSIAVIVNREGEIQVYPNPVSDRLYINLGSVRATAYELFESSGRLVKSGSIDQAVFSIAIGDLPQGSYFLQLQTSAGSQRFTIMKH